MRLLAAILAALWCADSFMVPPAFPRRPAVSTARHGSAPRPADTSDSTSSLPQSTTSRSMHTAAGWARAAAGASASAWVAWCATGSNARADSVPSGPRPANRPLAYSVEATDPPCLQPRTRLGELGAVRRFAEADVVIMGEHHASRDDHELQAKLLNLMLDEARGQGRKLAIGLEMVQRGNPQHQEALDAYVRSKGQGTSEDDADAALVRATDWANTWPWDFDLYKPVFHLARNRGVPLVALNVAGEAAKRVLDEGLDGLTDADRETYVPDPLGFVNSVKGDGFQRYTDRVILPAYSAAASSNALGKNPSPEKFFAARIFSDEAVAAGATAYVAGNPQTCLVVLAGEERVKFGYGLRERTLRGLRRLREGSTPAAANTASGATPASVPVTVLSVLLNPTAADSLSPTVQLQLVLAYGPFLKDQRLFADFLWFSRSPPVKILTRPKNPISNEGEKPPGESSIIGAF